jgi:hypothetical protein
MLFQEDNNSLTRLLETQNAQIRRMGCATIGCDLVPVLGTIHSLQFYRISLAYPYHTGKQIPNHKSTAVKSSIKFKVDFNSTQLQANMVRFGFFGALADDLNDDPEGSVGAGH